MGDIAHPRAMPTYSGALLDLFQHLGAALGLAFPFLHLLVFTRANRGSHPSQGPKLPKQCGHHLPSVASRGRSPNLWQTCRMLLAEMGQCFLGGWEARDWLFLLGRSCPSLLIGNNNPCPWSTLKNNPASEGLEGRPEAAACEHPGKEVRFWPRTSTAAGMMAGCCRQRWLQSHTKVSILASRSPLREPQNFITSHWEMVLRISLP